MNNRYEFVLLFDVLDGNPNGDPDAGNTPRMDYETGQGLVTDVCIKRKIRNYVTLTRENAPGYDIYVQEKAILNNQNNRAYLALEKEGVNKKDIKVDDARQWMCQNFYDVRTFGAVMSTGVNCGQVRGPVQFTFARSVDLVTPTDATITRMAVTTEKESIAQDGGNRTMGQKNFIPYGLFRMQGFVNAKLADQTEFTEQDLELLWEAIVNMFDYDRSAGKGLMTTCKLIIFKHESALGNAPAHRLFDLVHVHKKSNVEVARSFDDYEVTIDEPPAGVSIEIK